MTTTAIAVAATTSSGVNPSAVGGTGRIEETTATALGSPDRLHSSKPSCLVCYSELVFAGIAPCGHNNVCATCHLRLRYLHSDRKCPMCKTANEQLVVDRLATHKAFEEYPIWGDELGADFVHRSEVGMFFPTHYYETEIRPLFGYHCTAPKCPYDGTTPDPKSNNNGNGNNNNHTPTPLRALQDHLRAQHRLALCQLCVDFQRDFVAKLPRFTPSQLKGHLSKGDGPGSGFSGHPMCEFCRSRYYDLTQLHMHLQKDHYKCHVCDKQGLVNQFFRNYTSLEQHFDRQHFLCADPQCLAARFVVFDNEIDLRAHQSSTHGASSGSTKIQLEFRVRRAGHDGSGYEHQNVPSDEDFQYGLDGQAFVPEALPNNQNIAGAPDEAISHPFHVARTAELRAQAAQVRQEQEAQSAPEAFPTLNEAHRNDSANNLRVGWTSDASALQRIARNPVANTQEQFPSLPTTKNKAPSVADKVKGGGGVSGSRQFAVMRSAAFGSAPSATIANAPTSASWGASTPAATAPLRPTVAPSAGPVVRNREADLAPDNFPSLGSGSGTRYVAAENLARSKKETAPAIHNSSHFPPPPTSSAKLSVRQKVLEQKVAPPSKEVLNNFLDFPPPSSGSQLAQGKATVEQMKASLGPTKYKQLKNLTKEFASDAIAPEAYVDHAASLFDSGYADSEFWAFVPSLLASCPNERSSQQATRYMAQLRMNHSAPVATSSVSSGSAAGWSAPPNVSVAAGTTTQTTTTGGGGGWSSAAARPAATVRPMGVSTSATSYTGRSAPPVAATKKSAWNGGANASAVTRAKAPPGSVAVAAAQQGPQSGTATKFMAKETKQQKQQVQAKNPNKKKEKDELRALAFGR